MLKLNFPFLQDDTNQIGSVSSYGGKQHMEAEDDLKFLQEGNDDKTQEDKNRDEKDERLPDAKDKEEQEEKDEQEQLDERADEDKEDEEEQEDEQEDEEELTGALVTAKDVKEKYPDIFKKIPELKNVIYREQQYSQLFADPKEAQEASMLASTFREMEYDLVKGEIEPLFTAIKGTKEADFNKLAQKILPALRKIDEPTFLKVIEVPFKQMLRSAYNKGKSTDNKNLMYGAQWVHDFIFNDANLDEKVEFEQTDNKQNPEEEKYKKRLEELDRRDHLNFKRVVDDEWVLGIQSAFLDGLDKENTMSKWMKDRMVEDAIKEIEKQLGSDTRYQKSLEVLWRQAKASGYNAESKSRIVNTALARAKQLIPNIRVKLKSEAFAKSGKSESTRDKKQYRIPEERSNQGEKTQERRSSRPNPKKTEDMSELDVIRS